MGFACVSHCQYVVSSLITESVMGGISECSEEMKSDDGGRQRPFSSTRITCTVPVSYTHLTLPTIYSV